MKTIPLTQDKEAIVDDEDYEWLIQWKWYFNRGYAVRMDTNTKKTIFMHRVINNTLKTHETDHINRIKLDNRRENLRSVSKTINQRNKGKYKNNTSGILGVYWDNHNKAWRGHISVNSKRIKLGNFRTKEEAKQARLDYVIQNKLKGFDE